MSMELEEIKDYQHLLTDSDKEFLNYDPYQIPPDLGISELHELGNSIGESKLAAGDEFCPCCAQVPKKQLNPCTDKSVSSDMLASFGSGYPLY